MEPAMKGHPSGVFVFYHVVQFKPLYLLLHQGFNMCLSNKNAAKYFHTSRT